MEKESIHLAFLLKNTSIKLTKLIVTGIFPFICSTILKDSTTTDYISEFQVIRKK